MDATSPGTLLRQALEAKGWSQGQLASFINATRPHITRICHDRQRITPSMALRLARAFENDPKHWLDIQATYDLERCKERLMQSELV